MSTPEASIIGPIVAATLVTLCGLAVVRSYYVPSDARIAMTMSTTSDANHSEMRALQSRGDAPLSARLFEEEDEVNMVAERAEEAKEDQEELREKAEEEGGLKTGASGRAGETMLRAHMEIIGTRRPGENADPCVYPITLPPSGPPPGAQRPGVELRATLLAVNGFNGETRHFGEVSADIACTPDGGLYIDELESSTKIHLCPASCDWVRGAPHGARIDVLVHVH